MMKNVMTQAAAVILTGLFATAAIATDNKPVQAAQPVAASGGSMQVAFFDPVTKQLRAPTPEEAAAFAKSVELKRQQHTPGVWAAAAPVQVDRHRVAAVAELRDCNGKGTRQKMHRSRKCFSPCTRR